MKALDKVLSRDYDELRQKNLETIYKFFALQGNDFLEAWKLYADEPFVSVETTENARPESVAGDIKYTKEWYAYNVKHFPNWKTNELTVFQKEDPTRFLVVATSEGDVELPDYPKTHICTDFIHEFEMDDGKIAFHMTHTNPLVFVHDLNAGEIPKLIYPIAVRKGNIYT